MEDFASVFYFNIRGFGEEFEITLGEFGIYLEIFGLWSWPFAFYLILTILYSQIQEGSKNKVVIKFVQWNLVKM